MVASQNLINFKENNSIQVRSKIYTFYDEFMKYLDLNSKASYETYKYSIAQFLMYLSKFQLNPLDRKTILNYKLYLKENGYKASTFNTRLVAIKSFYKYLYIERYIDINIAEDIKAERVSKNYKKDIPSLIKAQEMIQRAKEQATTEEGKRNYCILLLALTTGIRENEVANIQLKDITFNNIGEKIIHLLRKGRNDKEEYVKLPYQVETAIIDYLASKKVSNNDYLFTSTSKRNYGDQLNTRTLRNIAKALFRNIGIESERFTFHSFRHYALTHILINGGTIEEARAIAGHSSDTAIYNYLHEINRSKNNGEYKLAQELKI